MMSTTIRNLTLAAAVGSGVTGGVFFGFSTFVMKALGRLSAPQAITAMQSINRFAPNPLFMTALFGTAAACVPLAVSGVRDAGDPAAKYLLIGSALFVAGVIVTIAYHVPRNVALAAIDPTGTRSAEFWSRYLHDWTLANHVRTATSIAATITLTLAARTR